MAYLQGRNDSKGSRGNQNAMHKRKEKLAVILVNLGTPDRPDAQSIRRYLAEFLSDRRVVNLPRLLWLPILYGIILTLRPRKLVENYRFIWGEEDAPIRVYTRRLAASVMHIISRQHTRNDLEVLDAMTYGNPSLDDAIATAIAKGADDLLFIPLFPQYSSATTAAVVDRIAKVFAGRFYIPSFRVVNSYYDHPKYIHALTKSLEQYSEQIENGAKLIFSFHGIPLSLYKSGDPYPEQCKRTAEQVAYSLALNETQWMMTFQSRFGPSEWLQPYTDITLSELAAQGQKSVIVVCPGFASDCLETLEEINREARDIFLKTGGEEFTYVPALNDDEDHVALISDIVMAHLYSDEMPE